MKELALLKHLALVSEVLVSALLLLVLRDDVLLEVELQLALGSVEALLVQGSLLAIFTCGLGGTFLRFRTVFLLILIKLHLVRVEVIELVVV